MTRAKALGNKAKRIVVSRGLLSLTACQTHLYVLRSAVRCQCCCIALDFGLLQYATVMDGMYTAQWHKLSAFGWLLITRKIYVINMVTPLGVPMLVLACSRNGCIAAPF